MEMESTYYENKLASLRSIFAGDTLELMSDCVLVDGVRFPIVDDVIVALQPSDWPPGLRRRLPSEAAEKDQGRSDFAPDIQDTFGAEWTAFRNLLPDHERWFRLYFDLVKLNELGDLRLCDLGCGMGRWSYFASQHCREIVLVDFSEAIFVARDNLRERTTAIFIMADIRRLPFRESFADLIFSLGVLHHLPTPALEEVARLKKYAPLLLVYLYYALDNRPALFRVLLSAATRLRTQLSKVRDERARGAITTVLAASVYRPFVTVGKLLRPFGLSRFVPLYDGYREMGWVATKQDVYDRFFTRIEQRFSAIEIGALHREFRKVTISAQMPYWHFLCER